MGHAGKFGFDDELRVDPDHVLAAFVRRQLDWAAIGAQRLETLPQIARRFLRIAGADAAGVTKLAVLVSGDGQRADRPGHGGRWRKAGDDEFLAAVAFGLDEIVRSAGAVGRVAALRHDAFEPHVAGMPVNERSVLVEMIRVADHAAFAGTL